jgi:hypothetical protein
VVFGGLCWCWCSTDLAVRGCHGGWCWWLLALHLHDAGGISAMGMCFFMSLTGRFGSSIGRDATFDSVDFFGRGARPLGAMASTTSMVGVTACTTDRRWRPRCSVVELARDDTDLRGEGDKAQSVASTMSSILARSSMTVGVVRSRWGPYSLCQVWRFII